MKLTKVLRHTYRNICLGKYQIASVFFMMCILLVLISSMVFKQLPEGVVYTVFDILSHVSGKVGITGIMALVFPIIPSFCFILISLINFDNQIYLLVRSKSRTEIWHKQVGYIFIIAFIYSITLVVGGYLYSGFLTGSFDNWRMHNSFVYSLITDKEQWIQTSNIFFTYKMIPIIFTSMFLGLCAFGFIVCVLKMLIKNTYVYIIVVIILFLDGMLDRFSLILKQMTINLNNWTNPFSILINDIYLLLVIITLSIIGEKLFNKKDFIYKL